MLELTLRNAGLGPALGLEVTPTFTQGAVARTDGAGRLAAVAPGETARFKIGFFFENDIADVQGDWLEVTGTFTDRYQRAHHEVITAWENQFGSIDRPGGVAIAI
ncbi:MAG TPA: hypothetical protein VG408_00650 [Actinomycetota bacterium]|nr:hypothetical protein [Actinomycetota bacterium]